MQTILTIISTSSIIYTLPIIQHLKNNFVSVLGTTQTGTGRKPTSNNPDSSSSSSDQNYVNELNIVCDKVRYYKKFKTQGRELTILLDEPRNSEGVEDWLDRSVRAIHEHIVRQADENSYVGMSCKMDNFSQGGPWLSFRPLRNFYPEDISDMINSAV